LTTTWEEELKLSEACLFTAGIMADGTAAKTSRAARTRVCGDSSGVGGLFDQWVIQITSPGVVLVAKCVRTSKIIGIGI